MSVTVCIYYLLKMNVSGTLNALKLVYSPSTFLPTVTVSTFNQLPVPLKVPGGEEIKVVLLDKDNCFAEPHSNQVWPEYSEIWAKLKKEYPGKRLMIVSNTSGSSSDPDGSLAKVLEEETGVQVFRHAGKKPGCYQEILDYLKAEGLVNSPKEIAVVGDRLMTDVAMANMMGSYSFWIRDGVIPTSNVFTMFERNFYYYMTKK